VIRGHRQVSGQWAWGIGLKPCALFYSKWVRITSVIKSHRLEAGATLRRFKLLLVFLVTSPFKEKRTRPGGH